jgi:hypothetical protein
MTQDAAARSWPAHREARGMLRLRHTLVDPAGEIGRSLQTLWSIHHGMLTISVEAIPGDRAFTRVAVRLAVEEVAVSILPGHHRLFTLSSQLGDRTDEVYCYAEDQRARNKWIAVFRRLGLAIYTRRQDGRLSCVLEPITEGREHSHGRVQRDDCPPRTDPVLRGKRALH